MNYKKLSIRWKITLSNIFLLTAIALILYFGSNKSANQAIEDIPMTQVVIPAKEFDENSQESSIPVAAIEIQLQTAKNTHRTAMNFYMIITILLGGIVTFIITKKSLKPLEDFEQSIKDTNMHKLSEKIVIPCVEPEVACLVDAFNDMTDKLEQSFALQKQFSHSVAHELRTPLSVTRTKIEVFQKKNRTSEEYEALFKTIQSYTRNLSDMVEDILQYSNLGDICLDDDIKISDMLLKVIAEIKEIYKDAHIILENGDISCKGNRVLLYQVFSNLIENACRYGQDAEDIRICTLKKDDTIFIKIMNQGVGISDVDKVQIFEPFFRIDKSRSRKFGGAGLGLFFCKEIVTRHSGTIFVSDNQPSGVVFTVTLPA